MNKDLSSEQPKWQKKDENDLKKLNLSFANTFSWWWKHEDPQKKIRKKWQKKQKAKQKERIVRPFPEQYCSSCLLYGGAHKRISMAVSSRFFSLSKLTETIQISSDANQFQLLHAVGNWWLPLFVFVHVHVVEGGGMDIIFSCPLLTVQCYCWCCCRSLR